MNPPCDYITPPPPPSNQPGNYHSNFHPPHYYQYPPFTNYNNYASSSMSTSPCKANFSVVCEDETLSPKYYAPNQEISSNSPHYQINVETSPYSKCSSSERSDSPKRLTIVTPSPDKSGVQNTSEHVQELDNMCNVNEAKNEDRFVNSSLPSKFSIYLIFFSNLFIRRLVLK